MRIRAMTFNIQHGLDYVFRRIDTHLMAETMKRVDADIIGVNEVRGVGFYPDEPYELKNETRFYAVFGAAIKDRFGEYGNLILSRYPIIDSEVIPIPDPENRPEGKSYESRCILKATVVIKSELTVLSTHFGLNADEQANAVETVCKVIDGLKTPFILLGDLNMTPDNAILKPLLERVNDAADMFCPEKLSFNSAEPTMRIDYVLSSRNFVPQNADIPFIVASDHRPLYADFDI